MVGKSQTSIVTLDLGSGEVNVWTRTGYGLDKDNEKVHRVLPEDYCVGKLQWGSDGVLFGIGVKTQPRRLGFIYCDNRPSHLFRLSPQSAKYEVIRGNCD